MQGFPERAVYLVGGDLDTAVVKTITIKQFKEFVDLTKMPDKEDTAENVAFRYHCNSSLLQSIRIVDTPGFDGTNAQQRERGKQARERAIQQSHLCVIVLSAGLSADDLECARLIQQQGVELVVVLNKSDKYDSDDRMEMQEQITTDLKREVGITPAFYVCSALWQNGSEQDREELAHQRRYFDEEDVAQWHQWDALIHYLKRSRQGEKHLALLSTIRRAFSLVVRVNEQYDRHQQAEITFLDQLPRWRQMMPSLVGQTVLEMAVSAAKSNKPLPWKRLENFGITPEIVAPSTLTLGNDKIADLLVWYRQSIIEISTLAMDTQNVRFYNAVLADNSPFAAFFNNQLGIHLRVPSTERAIQDALWYSQPLHKDFSYRGALQSLQSRWNARPSFISEDCTRLRNRLAAALA